jgi:hypothetical protein
MSRNHDGYYYLDGMLGYFHQDCAMNGETVEDIINEYIKTNWPYDRLGLRADIARFLHRHPDDPFDAMVKLFSMNAYPQPDNESMSNWLREVSMRLIATDNDPPRL